LGIIAEQLDNPVCRRHERVGICIGYLTEMTGDLDLHDEELEE
jgi:hypothetical protein